MHSTIELLVNGDANIVEYYRRAGERWREIWARPEASDVDELGNLLTSEQPWFERNCGGPRVGQEIMVVSAFGMLYGSKLGFENKTARARMIYDAFQRSYCSIRVKVSARNVAKSYGLLEVHFV